MNFTLLLKNVGINDLHRVGGKNASLGEMLQNLTSLGVNIPDGFVVTVAAYRAFIEHNTLDKTINETVDGIDYENITASRYAKGMMTHVRTHEPAILVDKLICGAYIEARSCERFAKLAPHLDDELHKFYISLLRSEARHFEDYLTLAADVAGKDITDRIHFFGDVEAELISSPDTDFKFHSGTPIC